MFFGHVVNQGIVKIDSRKVKAIMDWPAPTNVVGPNSWVGELLQKVHYGVFKNYAKHNQFVEEIQKWEWGDSCMKVFEKLKEIVAIRIGP